MTILFCALATVLAAEPPTDYKKLPDSYWKEKLTPEQYRVCRHAGTERPGSCLYLKHKLDGDFVCSSCGLKLFTANDKFDSGTGWPSFTEAVNSKNIELRTDDSMGMKRTEVRCGRCGAHLGHVFDDGPPPTGKRYCINSVCLRYVPHKK